MKLNKENEVYNMREIKFRVWDVRKQRMIYDVIPLIYIDGEQWYINSEWNSVEHYNDIPYQDSISMLVNAKRGIIMQYIGIKDKKGVDVYEGDIINIRKINYLVVHNYREARYELHDSANGVVKQFCSRSDSHLYDIVGNIYEKKDFT